MARRFHTLTPIAIPQTEAQRYASIPTHPETQQHLFEIVTPVFTMPVGWPQCPWGLWFIFIRSIERNRRGVLVQPGHWEWHRPPVL